MPWFTAVIETALKAFHFVSIFPASCVGLWLLGPAYGPSTDTYDVATAPGFVPDQPASVFESPNVTMRTPAVAIAVKSSGFPFRPERVAKRELPPTSPSVHRPTVAIPSELVVATSPMIVPPPLRTLNVTATP